MVHEENAEGTIIRRTIMSIIGSSNVFDGICSALKIYR
ncbi:hypothetical protein B0H39_000872 [Clostridium beijerinckii]|nr:hypothetical protein [Clostridium beijerinckii]NOW82991.1 hypothetical protein [Clostridium beijerinckii]